MNEAATEPGEGSHRRTCLIANRRGLHARAAANFVKIASQFEASVAVSCNGTRVSGHSILGLMMLAAGPGTEIDDRDRGHGCSGGADGAGSPRGRRLR